MLKYAIFLLLVGCRGVYDEPERVKDLKTNFENVWWEMTKHNMWETRGYTYCYYFDPRHKKADPPEDGAILYYEDGDMVRFFSLFERIPGGYYLAKYDIELEIFLDEDENYSIKASQGILSQKSDIVPCSLNF